MVSAEEAVKGLGCVLVVIVVVAFLFGAGAVSLFHSCSTIQQSTQQK